MNIIIFIIIFNLIGCIKSPLVVITEEGKYKDYTYTVPFDISGKTKKETLADLGIIYEGMPAENLSLYGFRQENLISSYQRNNKQYLTFPHQTESGKVIVFIIEGGKIRDWFETNL